MYSEQCEDITETVFGKWSLKVFSGLTETADRLYEALGKKDCREGDHTHWKRADKTKNLK
jgi:hypothetical protein